MSIVSLNRERLTPVSLESVNFGIAELTDVDSPNLLVQGEAGSTLQALLSTANYRDTYAGHVKLCYIDPPFNRGDDFDDYRDSLPKDAWLEMLRGTLKSIRGALRPDGSVWMHIDDGGQHLARMLLDEVFGRECFVATVIWQKRTSRDNRTAFSSMHDYIHVYSPLGTAWKRVRNGIPDNGSFANPDRDPRGPWRSVPMTAQAGHGTQAQHYTVTTPSGRHHLPPKGRCWTYTERRLQELDAAGRVYWPKAGDGKPRLKRYQDEVNGLAPFTIWPAVEVGDNATAKKALLAELPDVAPFATPKPIALLERIISIATNPDELVLDCFLGSGTTAIAATTLGRRWLGIERNGETLHRIAIPRLRYAANDGAHPSSFRLAQLVSLVSRR